MISIAASLLFFYLLLNMFSERDQQLAVSRNG